MRTLMTICSSLILSWQAFAAIPGDTSANPNPAGTKTDTDKTPCANKGPSFLQAKDPGTDKSAQQKQAVQGMLQAGTLPAEKTEPVTPPAGNPASLGLVPPSSTCR